MLSPFRYVEQDLCAAVTLHLFINEGTYRGTVRGPADHKPENSTEFLVGLPLADAFARGIRMANSNDVDLVVSGDRSLWNPLWGRLESS